MSLHHQPAKSGEEQDILLAHHKLVCDDMDGLGIDARECPPLWDGLLCWPPTSPGFILQPCPGYFAGFNTQMNASKVCSNDYVWANWTNYSQCYDHNDVTVLVDSGVNTSVLWADYIPLVAKLSEFGFGISGCTLMVAFIILVRFKRLRCPRNKLHLHLFVSFIMRAFMSFLKRSIFEEGIAPLSDFQISNGRKYYHQKEAGNLGCKLLTTTWQYFIMANYSWLLMEGLYIHNVIMWALSADTSRIINYIIFGWGLPVVVTLHWVVARTVWDNHLCWTTYSSSNIQYITFAPIIASFTINFMLFVNILRLLMSKVQTSIQEEAQRYWRLAKSTLVLVVLFGVPYFFGLVLYSLPGDEVHLVWLFLDQLFTSFQGFIVALLYCFLNSEVQDELGKAWRECAGVASVPDTLPTTSCASWSSAHSAAHSPSKCYMVLKCLLPCVTRPNSRTTRRTDTVDCIVCESCGNEERNKNSFNDQCQHLQIRDNSDVEMKLINNEKSHVSSIV